MSERPLIHVVVTAGTPDAVKRTWLSVVGQTWTQVSQDWPAPQAGPDDLLVVLAPGTQLEATALEKVWWFLHTHPSVGFATGIDALARDGAISKSSAAFIAVRINEVGAIADTEWCNDTAAPGLSLAIAMLSQSSARGRQLLEFTHGRGPNAEVDARVAALGQAGLTDALLGETGDSLFPVLPLQRIETRALPQADARIAESKGKRVLVLLQGFPMGGYAAFNSDILPRLAVRGHALSICTTESWRSTWGLDAVREVTSDVFHAPGLVPLHEQPRFIDWLITSRKIEVVFLSHCFAAYRALPWLRARHPNVAFVDYVHTDWFEVNMYGSYAAMSASYADSLDVHLASSSALARELVERGADADGVSTCTINVDPTQWDPEKYRNKDVRKSLGSTENSLLVLFAARVSTEKRPLMALDLIRALRAEGHDAKLVVAGNGPQLAELIQAATDAGMRDVCQFLGEVDQEKLKFVYANCDVYCVPSEIEGIARTLYEAMAMALPVIAADVGGQRELATEECGTVVPRSVNEREEYLAALRKFLAPAARKKAGAASRARIIAHFSSRQCVQNIENGFALAIDRRAHRQSVLPANVAIEMATMGLEIQRRHANRSAGR